MDPTANTEQPQMDWAEDINSKIEAEEGKSLSLLFRKDRETLQGIESLDLSRIRHPFDVLLSRHRAAALNYSYEESELLAREAVDMVGSEKWAAPVVKRIVCELLRMKTQGNSGRMGKLLSAMHRALVGQGSPASVYVGNALVDLYLETGRFASAEEVLEAGGEPETLSRDYYAFHYYKGIILMYSERFKEAYLSLEKAFGYRRWRRVVAPVYFISSLLVNKFPRRTSLERFGCDYLEELVLVLKAGAYGDVDGAIERVSARISDPNLGLVMFAYCPLVCFSNLVCRTYQQHGCDNKLAIEKMAEALPDISFKETICLLSSVIALGRLRGYISINRKVVVFSRADPFPALVR